MWSILIAGVIFIIIGLTLLTTEFRYYHINDISITEPTDKCILPNIQGEICISNLLLGMLIPLGILLFINYAINITEVKKHYKANK